MGRANQSNIKLKQLRHPCIICPVDYRRQFKYFIMHYRFIHKKATESREKALNLNKITK